MIIDVYKSTTNDDKYLSVPAGSDVNQLNLPEDLDPDLLDLTEFKTGLEIDLNMPRMGLDQESIHRQITEKGYAIHGANMDVSISMSGSSFM